MNEEYLFLIILAAHPLTPPSIAVRWWSWKSYHLMKELASCKEAKDGRIFR
jgi:hypothetical protein